MLSRLTRFYGGTPEAWANRPIDVVCEMNANIQHLNASEAALDLLVNHPKDPERTMDDLRDKAEFIADDEPAESRMRRLRAKEEAMLAALGGGLQDKRR